MTRDSITAEISNSVAENAVCWCDGRKKRSSFVIETRFDVPSYRNLNQSGSCAADTPSIYVSSHNCSSIRQLSHLPGGATYTCCADTKSAFWTSVLILTLCSPGFLGGLARNARKYWWLSRCENCSRYGVNETGGPLNPM